VQIAHMKNEALRILIDTRTPEAFRDLHIYDFLPNSQAR